MFSRVSYKSVVRQYPRRNRLCTHLQRLSLFTTFVILVSAFKHLSQEKIQRVACFSSNGCNVHSSNSSSSNHSIIVVGGLQLKRDECLTSHLETLPRFASDFCRNHSDNCTGLTCLNVLTGSGLDKYESIIKLIPPQLTTEQSYFNVTDDCQKYKQDAGYVLRSVDEESKNFPIAFNILMHTGIDQFELLLKALYRPQNSFCIHVDKKSPADFQRAVRSIAECFDNVFLASQMESIRWAGYNRLQADITCMKDQLSRNITWKYLINTAGQAFPLRTVEEMVDILKIYNGANDIEGIYGKRILKGRFENEWVEGKDGLTKTGKKNPKPPHNIDIVRGSAYGIFSRKFVEFIVGDKRAKDLLQWSRNTWSPDELYWATLHHTYSNPHLKTPGGFSGYPSDKKWLAVYANWGEKPCHGRNVRGVCVNGLKDVVSLIDRKEFFANKFYHDYQPLALSCLSAWIDFKTQCRAPLDLTFYRSLNFIKKSN